jgi:hypothetical protein
VVRLGQALDRHDGLLGIDDFLGCHRSLVRRTVSSGCPDVEIGSGGQRARRCPQQFIQQPSFGSQREPLIAHGQGPWAIGVEGLGASGAGVTLAHHIETPNRAQVG